MGVHYIIPEQSYNSDQVDPMITKLTRNDMYQPEFDALGLSPVTLGEFIGCNFTTQSALPTVSGYRARYSEYKSRVSKCHGPFQSGGSLDYWTTPWVFGKGNIAAFNPGVYKISPDVS